MHPLRVLFSRCLKSPLVLYLTAVTATFGIVVILLSLLAARVSSQTWAALSAVGQALEAYVVLATAGAIYIQLSRRKEETVEHRIQVFQFLRSVFHGEDFERWFRILVAYGRGAPVDLRSQRDHKEMIVTREELTNMARDVLATLEILNGFIARGDLTLDDLVDYQGDRLWELDLAFGSLEFQPTLYNYNVGWGRRQARDLLERTARRWRQRGDEMGLGTFPHTWP
ncbi:MAG: hypothetical protein MUO38_10600 [Anaerolineales bacterium]|nr:hypothetical protein [Anaerolineales bacterium]